MPRYISRVLAISILSGVASANTINFKALVLGEVIASNYNQGQGPRFGENKYYSTFCNPRLVLSMDAKKSDEVSAHASVNFRDSCGYGGKNDEWTFRKYGMTDKLFVKYAPKTNPSHEFKIGIQYAPYGEYLRHHIPASIPQLLTQTQAIGIVGKYMPAGSDVEFSYYVINTKKKRDKPVRINNIGGKISYNVEFNKLDAYVSASIIKNMAGAVNYVTHVGNSSSTNPLNNSYRRAVPGLSLSTFLSYEQHSVHISIAKALAKFNINDLAYKNDGASPLGFGLSYIMAHETLFNKKGFSSIGFQYSDQAVNIRGNNQGRGLPRHRVYLSSGINFKHSKVGLHVVYDKDYKIADGGTDKSNITTMLSYKLNLG